MAIDSVMDRMQQAIAEILQTVSLPDFPQGNLYLGFTPNQTVMLFPCIAVTYEKSEERWQPWAFGRNEFQYPWRIRILARNAEEYTAQLSDFLLWRNTIMQALIIRPELPQFPNVPEVYHTAIEPDMIFEEEPRQYQYYGSAFILRCYSVENDAANPPDIGS